MIEGYKNLEIINISTKNGKLVALISYRNVEDVGVNNGFDTVEIPINLRDIQMGAHGGMLVNQSVKGDSIATSN